MNNELKLAIIDLIIIAVSVAAAVILAEKGILNEIFNFSGNLKFVFLYSFMAGIFFVSLFTAAPATVAIIRLAENNSLFLIALFAGFGALFGDFIIFRFARDRLSNDFLYLFKMLKINRNAKIFGSKLVKYLMTAAGALIIATPFPDELGILLMGISKIRIHIFILISFFLNFSGILLMIYVSKII